MKKLLLSAFVIFSFFLYALDQRLKITALPASFLNTSAKGSSVSLAVGPSEDDDINYPTETEVVITPNPTTKPGLTLVPISPSAKPRPTAASVQPTATIPTSAPAPTSPPAVPTPVPTVASGYKDGSYTGSVADAYYGNVQVKVVISGGKIIDVQFVDYPHERPNSQVINATALPALKSKAIQAQSANVDIVSGATFTSQAFQKSLASALSQAKG